MIKQYVLNLFITILISMFFISSSNVYAVNFSDLPEDHWAYNAISKMTEEGILSGYPDGTFAPGKTIIKAEFAKILVQTLKLEKINNDIKYEDVPEDFWAYEYIKIAEQYFVSLANENQNMFFPNQTLTREEVAAIIVRAMSLEEYKYNDETLNQIIDNNEISEELKKYVAIIYENNLMHGNANGTFNPKGSLTRAEVCQLMRNIIDIKTNIDADADFNTDINANINTDNNSNQNPNKEDLSEFLRTQYKEFSKKKVIKKYKLEKYPLYKEILDSFSKDNKMKFTGYKLYDLNSDSKPELLIGIDNVIKLIYWLDKGVIKGSMAQTHYEITDKGVVLNYMQYVQKNEHYSRIYLYQKFDGKAFKDVNCVLCFVNNGVINWQEDNERGIGTANKIDEEQFYKVLDKHKILKIELDKYSAE